MIFFAIAVAIAAYPAGVLALLIRPLLGIAAVPGLRQAFTPLRRVELVWIGLSVTFVVATLITTVTSADRAASMADLARQAFVFSFSVLFMWTLREPSNRRLLCASLSGSAVVIGTFIGGIYVWFNGVSVPRIIDAKASNYEIFESLGIAFNPLSFALVLAMLMSSPVWWSSMRARTSFILFGAIVVMIAGSRTTIASLLLAAMFTYALLIVAPRSRIPRRALVLSCLVLLVASAFMIRPLLDVDDFQINDWTAGRWALWDAGLARWVDRPVVGWGGGTWHLGLQDYLPMYDIYRNEAIISLESGSFHNEFVTLLAEKGLVGFIPGVAIMVFVWRSSVAVWRKRDALGPIDRRIAQVAPFGTAILLVRAFSEQPGILGHANAIVDYLAFAFVALVLALRGSIEEPRGRIP